MSTLAPAAVRIDLHAACGHGSCAEWAWKFKRQLDVPNYSRGAAIMKMPESLEQWRAEHRTARKRADRAHRLGYRFDAVDYSRFNDDIHEINTSLQERQGRPMADGYMRRIERGPLPAYACERHRTHTYGVLQGKHLRAYLTLHVAGELHLVSMILGHGAHLANDVMYALFAGVVERHAGSPGVVFYNSWSSGTEGLRYFKSKLGFERADLEWSL